MPFVISQNLIICFYTTLLPYLCKFSQCRSKKGFYFTLCCTHFILLSLQVMHGFYQQSPPSPCERLHCSHLCLLAPGARWELSAMCRCPRGHMLSRDAASCSAPADDSFILLLSRDALHQVAISKKYSTSSVHTSHKYRARKCS